MHNAYTHRTTLRIAWHTNYTFCSCNTIQYNATQHKYDITHNTKAELIHYILPNIHYATVDNTLHSDKLIQLMHTLHNTYTLLDKHELLNTRAL